MNSQVKVILRALDLHITPSERIITLTPDRPSFRVGRASKSVSKGLQGARDNAWFDSPVMSRDHAEITFNGEEKILTITDIGSMHGTHLNEHTLPVQTKTPIDDGDVVVFGAEVKRGPETFPACAFCVNYEISPYRSANTFAFPDSSDIEDEEEEDYELSEDSLGGQDRRESSDDGVSIELVSVKPAQHPHAIDLTRDESPAGRLNNPIDLSGDISETANDIKLRDIAKEGSPTRNVITRVGFESQEPLSNYSTDSESDSQPEIPDATPFGFVVDSDEESSEEEDGEDDQDEDLMVERLDTKELSQPRALENTDQEDSGEDYDEEGFVNPVSDEETDDRSELGLSDAGAEGIRALLDGGLLANDHIPFGFASSQSETDNITTSNVPFESSSFNSPFAQYTATAGPPYQSSTTIGSYQLAQVNRQPSPSDAAMVKSVGESSVQSLGDKSGKAAYFNAREANKVRFQQARDGAEQPNSSTIPKCGLMPPFSAASTFAMPTREQCSFLDGPDTSTISARDPSPQPDMTSAVVYNNSKQSLAAAAKSNRSGIKIKDIIETPLLQRTENLKRKAADISDVTDDKHKTWPNLPVQVESTVTPTAPKSQGISQGTSVNKVTMAIASSPVQSENRPTKKQKILEIIGYTALGGVTIGATVFAALVATAPTF